MKRIIQNTLFAVALSTLVFTGCSKTEDVVPENTNNTNNTTPSLKDGYGMLAAVTSISYTTVAGITIPVTTNTAVAAFQATMGSSTYVDAGTVTLNSKTLTKQSGNSYVYQNLTDPLSFPPVTWSVSGSSSVPAFNYTNDKPMPAYSGYSELPSTITKSVGVTISLGSAVSNADSVYVVISGGSNSYLLKRVGGSAAQVVFSSADLSTLGTTSVGMIQVTPWNYKKEDFNNKPYYFVNETAYSKIGVTIN